MKKTMLLFFSLTILFTYEITNQKIFTLNYKPNIYKTHINIKIKEKNLNQLIEKLNINIKKLNNICQKINYIIYPDYIYNKNQKKFSGYIANINSNCQFPIKKIKQFSDIFSKLKGEKTLSSIHLDIDKQEKEKLINRLKIKAYSYALKDAKNLSKKLNLNCFAANISLNRFPPHQKPLYKSLNTLPSPKENKKETINVFYKIICF